MSTARGLLRRRQWWLNHVSLSLRKDKRRGAGRGPRRDWSAQGVWPPPVSWSTMAWGAGRPQPLRRLQGGAGLKTLPEWSSNGRKKRSCGSIACPPMRKLDAGQLRVTRGLARRGQRSRGTATGSQASLADAGHPGDVTQTLPSGPASGGERGRVCSGTASFQ